MQYLVLTSLDTNASPEIVKAGLEAEYQQVRHLIGADALRQIWRREDRRGAVLVFGGYERGPDRVVSGKPAISEGGCRQS